MSKKNNNPAIEGMDAKLAGILETMVLDGWEIRTKSNGSERLYIRCKRRHPEISVKLG